MKRIGNTLPWESVDLEETGLVHSAIDFVDLEVAVLQSRRRAARVQGYARGRRG